MKKMAKSIAKEQEPLLPIELTNTILLLNDHNETSHTNRIRHKCSLFASGLNCTSFLVGTGLLNLPLAFVETGWCCGLLLMCSVAVITCYTAMRIVECLDIVRWTTTHNSVSYGDVAREAFGAPAQWLTTLFVHLSLAVSAIGCLCFSATCISMLFGVQYTTACVVLSCFVWLHIFVRSMSDLAVLSAINLALSYWIEVVIIGDAMHPYTSSSNNITLASTPSKSFIFDCPISHEHFNHAQLAYTIILFVCAFFCHAAIPTIYCSLSERHECSKVLVWSQIGCLITLYFPICIMTYAAYGTNLKVPVYINLRNTTVHNAAILFFAIHLLLVYSVTLFPVEVAFENQVFLRFSNILPSSSSGQYTIKCVKFASRTVLVVSSLAVALISEQVLQIVYTIMVIPVVCLALIFPCLFYIKLFGKEISRLKLALNAFIVALGIWCLTFGFISIANCS